MQKTLLKIYDELYKEYGPQDWWPGDTSWEIATGAILTQNTNWKNVEKAIKALKAEKMLFPQAILMASQNKIAELIKPSGYFNVKSLRLKFLAEWWIENASKISENILTMKEARKSILTVNGVGPETADSILLYSFNMPTFVIDAYTRRIFSDKRTFTSLLIKKTSEMTYDDWRSIFMNNLPHDAKLYNEYHALIVCCAKKTKKRPSTAN
ncbi:MAG: endonuclease III domain-containing protein [Verrucomicrobiota bacterium]|nr:endonuclease III domain-containing protein [Verrucomicrobiota bacterium]